eukprot:TRINITY_DN16356_c0_g1_i1.p1 TRINITY_DN16356_c0_g1~~TRINITY_DN16356_c0_g1_i1.p1  ORF type:complete len:711 (+),score=130.84 TRINITY_DN16356_c0_g1_i1:17-2149(+)
MTTPRPPVPPRVKRANGNQDDDCERARPAPHAGRRIIRPTELSSPKQEVDVRFQTVAAHLDKAHEPETEQVVSAGDGGSIATLRPAEPRESSPYAAEKASLQIPTKPPLATTLPLPTHASAREKTPSGAACLRASSARAVSKENSGSSDDLSPAIHWRHFRRGMQEGSVRDNFVWSEADELGRGAFGRVFRGKSCYHGTKMVAIKILSRASVHNVDNLWSEINILSDLDHPNILRMLEAYEDSRNIYIVTEVCQGGPLDDWLDRVKGDAAFARRVALEVTGVLAHCHSRGICHRDLKLDNILLLRDSVDSPVRVADFGLAKRCSSRIVWQRLAWNQARAAALSGGCEQDMTQDTVPQCPAQVRSLSSRRAVKRNTIGAIPWAESGSKRQASEVEPEEPAEAASGSKRPVYVRMKSVTGTPEYMAPEVIHMLNRQMNENEDESSDDCLPDFYDFRCDVWSLGVCLCTLLLGKHPYDLEQVSRFVAEGEPLPELKWDNVAEDPVEFIEDCLQADFRKRPHAEDLMRYDWLSPGNALHVVPTPSSASFLAKRFRAFAGLSQFKRAALLAAVRHLGSYEHEELRKVFQKVDVQNTGEVPVQDLMKVLSMSPSSPSGETAWIDEAVRMADAESKGSIAYTEFLAAVMDPNIEDRKDLALAAFRGFDLNGDGSLTSKELERVLKNCDSQLSVIREGDQNGDGELDFEEFVDLLRKG